jgi:cell division septum initiation protein DivIVA
MAEHSRPRPDFSGPDIFEVQMRGYNRRQVDEYVARTRGQIMNLQEQLARLVGETEQLRQELAAARRAGSTPAPAGDMPEQGRDARPTTDG